MQRFWAAIRVILFIEVFVVILSFAVDLFRGLDVELHDDPELKEWGYKVPRGGW